MSEADALDYVLGYTAGNDISSRTSQLSQSQWCFSKGFDSACPIGTIVSSLKTCYMLTRGRSDDRLDVVDTRSQQAACSGNTKRAGDARLRNRVRHHLRWTNVGANERDSDLIFSVPKLVSFLSQGTTLPVGTIIMTGTPAGVGFVRNPKVWLKEEDEFSVEILPHIGTLVNKFENEK